MTDNPSASGESTHRVVPLEGRATLPFLTIHGKPLVCHALEALERLGAVTVTADRSQFTRARRVVPARFSITSPEEFWRRTRGRVLLHDCLCPLTPAEFLAQAEAGHVATAAYRPVTDTLKVIDGDAVGGTLNRDDFAIITSPVLLVDVIGPPPTADFGELVAWLRERGEVAMVRAPQAGRRAVDEASVSVLESLDLVERAVHHDQARRARNSAQ